MTNFPVHQRRIATLDPIVEVTLPEMIEPSRIMKWFGAKDRHTNLGVAVSLSHESVLQVFQEFRTEDFLLDFGLYLKKSGHLLRNVRMFNVHIGARRQDARYVETSAIRDGRVTFAFVGDPLPVQAEDMYYLGIADEFECFLDMRPNDLSARKPGLAPSVLPLRAVTASKTFLTSGARVDAGAHRRPLAQIT